MNPLAGSSGMELTHCESTTVIHSSEGPVFRPLSRSPPKDSISITRRPGSGPGHTSISSATLSRARHCRCRLSLYLGFLIPALLVAAAFFVVTWITLDRSAKDSIEMISNRVFDVTMLHLQHSIDTFLRTLPMVANMVQAQLETNSSPAQMKQFVAKSLLSLEYLTAIGVAKSDGSFFVVQRVSNDDVRWNDKPPDNCTEIQASKCMLMTMWRMNLSTFQPIDPLVAEGNFSIFKHSTWLTLSRNQAPTYWLMKELNYLLTEPSAAYSQPLFHPDGSFRGFITIDAVLTSLSVILQSAQAALRTSGRILLVNDDGEPVASSVMAKPDGGLGALDLAQLLKLPADKTTRIDQLELNTFGHSFILSTSFRGKDHTAYEGTLGGDWRVFVIVPHQDFFYIIDHQNRMEIGLSVGCIVAFAAVLAILFRLLLTLPFRQLSKHLLELKEIVSFRRIDFGDTKKVVSRFSELVDLHEHVLDVVAAAETAAEERVSELRKAAEAERAHERTENLMRSKEIFFTMMGHQMRHPIRAILANAEFLMKTTLSVRQRENIDAIIFAGANMLNTVGNISDFAKLEAEQFDLDSVLFNPVHVVQSVAQTMEMEAEQANLELIVHIDRRAPTMYKGDSARLTQILLNLVSNAIRFTSDGYVLMRCSVDAEAKRLWFAVEDTGIGMSAEAVKDVFEVFRPRLGSAANPGSHCQRSGVLPNASAFKPVLICKRMVSLMGGELTAHSFGEGEGSTFQFYLPIWMELMVDNEVFSGSSQLTPSATVPSTAYARSLQRSSSPNAVQEFTSIPNPDRNSSDDEELLRQRTTTDSLNAGPSEKKLSVMVLDGLAPRRQALTELVRQCMLDDVQTSSLRSLQQLPYDDPATEVALVIAHLSEFSGFSSDPSKVVQMIRSTHMPQSMNRKVVLIANMKNPSPNSTPKNDPVAHVAQGFVLISKPVTFQKLTKCIDMLLPGVLKIYTSPVEPMTRELPDISYDKEDMESIVGIGILLIEHNPIDQNTIQRQLFEKGFTHIDVVSSKSEAMRMISQAKKDPYDAVLIETDLPETNVIDLVRWIKSIPLYKKVLIAGLCKSNQDERTAALLDHGVEVVLLKPLDLHELISRIKNSQNLKFASHDSSLLKMRVYDHNEVQGQPAASNSMSSLASMSTPER